MPILTSITSTTGITILKYVAAIGVVVGVISCIYGEGKAAGSADALKDAIKREDKLRKKLSSKLDDKDDVIARLKNVMEQNRLNHEEALRIARASQNDLIAELQKDIEQYYVLVESMKQKNSELDKELNEYLNQIPADGTCVFEPDFLRLWNKANAGSN